MQTLVLNQAYEPIQLVGWEKAIYLLVTEKADLVLAYSQVIRSVSITLNLPKVVRLKSSVRLTRRRNSKFSKRLVYERDRWFCQYCDQNLCEKSATIDHVMPSSRGGKTDYLNIVTSCSSCNAKKANKTPLEAKMKLKRKPREPDRVNERSDLRRAYEDFIINYAG